MNPGKVIIAGGSVGGLFAGVLLARAGWEVVIYERSSSGLSGKGAGLVPQLEVGTILDEIGRSDVMDTGVVARERIFLNRDGSVRQRLRVPQAQISWDLLFNAFRSLVKDAQYHSGVSIVRAHSEANSATLHFEDGSSDTADLVIGADGIGSAVRSVVAPGTSPHYAGYAAFRGLAPESQLPEESADVLSDRFTFYDAYRTQVLGYLVAGPDGCIAPGQRRYNWVWYRPMTQKMLDKALTSDSGEMRIYSAPPFGLSSSTRRDMVESARQVLPSILADVITREPGPFLQAIFDYEAPVLAKGRLLLLGDAAFVVRPHTAMGVSKAAGDALTLRNALRDGDTMEEALAVYSLQRQAEGHSIAHYGRRLGATFTEREA